VDLVDLAADDPRLIAFHSGIYWDAFAAQHEPVEAWQRALRGELPHRMTVRLALDDDGDAILGGIAFEHYPRSGCGLATYMVVAPVARNSGLGKQLLAGAVDELHAAGAPAVFGEVNDPRIHGEAARPRLERFLRWGARILEARYVQPSLGPGLARDRGLLLLALAGSAPLPPELAGATLRAFVEELYAITEGNAPDPEVAIPERVALRTGLSGAAPRGPS
jgi:GNAT superfamily N-acetyltransferase